MKRKALTIGIMGSLAALSMAAVPAAAEAHGWHRGYDRGYHGGGYYRGGGHYDRGYYGRGYYGRHHRCHGGTGGAIVGAVAGGLLGNAVAGYGDRTAGTIIGGGLGALAGNAIARDC